MSASNSVPSSTNRRKLYQPPKVTKLTPEAAKISLERNSIPGDKQTEKLLEAIKPRLEK